MIICIQNNKVAVFGNSTRVELLVKARIDYKIQYCNNENELACEVYPKNENIMIFTEWSQCKLARRLQEESINESLEKRVERLEKALLDKINK